MPLLRTSSGLLFEDDFNRANGPPGPNWQLLNGNTKIDANTLLGDNVSANARDTAEERSEMVVEGEITVAAGQAGGPTVRHSADNWAYYYQLEAVGQAVNLFIRNPGYTFLGLSVPLAFTPGTMVPYKLYVKNGVQKSWWKADGSVILHSTHAGMDAKIGTGGLHHNSGGRLDNCRRLKNNSVVCAGLPAGHKCRVGTRVAVEVAGTATVDLDKDRGPRPMIEVLDAGDVVIEFFDGFAAGDGVMAGDTWDYAAPVPDINTVEVIARTGISAWLALENTYVDFLYLEAEIVLAGAGFAAPLASVASTPGAEADHVWIRGLVHNTKYDVRVRAQRTSGPALWFETSFYTLNVPLVTQLPIGFAPYSEKDRAIDVYHALHGSPGLSWQEATPFTPEGFAEFGIPLQGRYGVNYATRGALLNFVCINYNQETTTAQGHAVRVLSSHVRGYNSAFDGPLDGGRYTMMAAFIPLQARYEVIMGNATFWVWKNATNELFMSFARTDDITYTQKIGDVVLNEINVAFIGSSTPRYSIGGIKGQCICGDVFDGNDAVVQFPLSANPDEAPSSRYMGALNGVVANSSAIRAIMALPWSCDVPCISGYHRVQDGRSYIDWGMGSPWGFTSGEIPYAGQFFKGIMVEGAFWGGPFGQSRFLGAAEIFDITNAILTGAPNPKDTILATNPLLYLPFEGYAAPNKPTPVVMSNV